MPRLERTSPLAVAACAVVGLAAGLLLQFALSARGLAPFVPPVSLAATLAVIAIVLVVLGIGLRRAVTRASGRPVNPFHAVRLLAGARAGQFVGALLGGFGGGLLVQVLTRTVVPSAATWAPMLLVLLTGIGLAVAGLVAELLCRVPPTDPDADAEAPGEPGADAGEQLA